MNKSKPNVLVLFSLIAIAMSGCGKSNSAATAPIVPNGQYNNGQYNPGGGQLSGVTATFAGTVYMDSANVQTSQGPSYQCPGTENFTAQPLNGQSQDGVILIYGQRNNCSANVQIQIQLSQIVVQDIMYKMQMYGMQPNIASVTVHQLSIGRYGTSLYGGGLPTNIGPAAALLVINGSVPYYVYF